MRRALRAWRGRTPAVLLAVCVPLFSPLACSGDDSETATSGNESASETPTSESTSEGESSNPVLTIQTVTSVTTPSTTGSDTTAGETEDAETEDAETEALPTCEDRLQQLADAAAALGTCVSDTDCIKHENEICGAGGVPGCILLITEQDDLGALELAQDEYVNAGCELGTCECPTIGGLFCDPDTNKCAGEPE